MGQAAHAATEIGSMSATDWHTRFEQFLWGQDLSQATSLRRKVIHALQLIYALLRDLIEGQLTLRAMSLVYTTLLSLVPLLALSFSVLKAFGVHNQIRPTLLTVLEPLGPKGVEITNQIIGFVENMRVGVLGAVGLALLVYTVVALLHKIESAFNHVWRVQRARRLAQRFSQYLSVLTVGPMLVFAALGVTATLFSHRVVQALADLEPLGSIVAGIGRLVPYLLVIGAFLFVYMFMPNTKVRLRPALAGAVVAGILWQSVGWGFASFVAGSTKYAAIYAGFAIVILAMIWLYLNWLIVLVGASIAFYWQHPENLATHVRDPQLSNRAKERIALQALAAIGARFQRNEPAWTLDGLAQYLHVPLASLGRITDVLVRGGFLAETADDPSCYLPARAFDAVPLKEVLDAIRTAGDETMPGVASTVGEPQVEATLTELDAAIGTSLRARTLRDLVRESPPRT
jgi:membrane protein